MVTGLCNSIREPNVAIITDRFFTSVPLLKTLPYACVGTVMVNRKYLPEIKTKLQRGQSEAKCTNDGIVCYKWQDTKEVIINKVLLIYIDPIHIQ